MPFYTEIKPIEPLRNFIACFCILENMAEMSERKIFRLIPEAHSQLVVYYDDDNYIDQNNCNSVLPNHPLIGPLTSYRVFEAIGKVGLFSIVFKATGLNLLIKDSLNGIKDCYYTSDCLNTFIRDLRDQLIEAKTNLQRIKIANQLLCDFYYRKSDSSKIRLPINAIVSYIQKRNGNVDINLIANQFNCSVSMLERHFKEITALSPKTFSRIIRLQSAIKRGFQHQDIMDIAISLGYYDQSHFIKDFKSFTGYSPAKYFKSDESYKSEFLTAQSN